MTENGGALRATVAKEPASGKSRFKMGKSVRHRLQGAWISGADSEAKRSLHSLGPCPMRVNLPG